MIKKITIKFKDPVNKVEETLEVFRIKINEMIFRIKINEMIDVINKLEAKQNGN